LLEPLSLLIEHEWHSFVIKTSRAIANAIFVFVKTWKFFG